MTDYKRWNVIRAVSIKEKCSPNFLSLHPPQCQSYDGNTWEEKEGHPDTADPLTALR